MRPASGARCRVLLYLRTTTVTILGSSDGHSGERIGSRSTRCAEDE
jgi:hypothetical protein